MTWVTLKHQREAFPETPSFADKVEIFYQQAWGWQLRIADLLANGGEPIGGGDRLPPVRHSGFAVLHICLSYFEAIGHAAGTRGGSEACFNAGVRSVFPSLELGNEQETSDLLKLLYHGLRCRLYHSSRTVGAIGLGQPVGGEAFAYYVDDRMLIISPERLSRTLLSHLEQYRERFLDLTNLTERQAFERWFDKQNR